MKTLDTDTETFDDQFQRLHQAYWNTNFSDEAANELATLINNRIRAVLTRIQNSNLNSHDREDIAQSATLSLLNKCGTALPGEIRLPAHYIKSTIRNGSINYSIRGKRRFPSQFPQTPDGETPYERIIMDPRNTDPAAAEMMSFSIQDGFTPQEEAVLRGLIRAVDAIFEACQYGAILENRFFGAPRKDMSKHAEEIGTSLSTYKRRSHVAMKRLKAAMEELPQNEVTEALKQKIDTFDRLSAKTQNRITMS